MKEMDNELKSILQQFETDIDGAIYNTACKYRPLLYAIHVPTRSVDSWDIEGIILDSVYKALTSYDSNSSAKFSTYLVTIFKNKVTSLVRYNSAETKQRYIEPMSDSDIKNSPGIGATSASDLIIAISQIDLSDREREYLLHVVTDTSSPMSLSEIAKLMNVSKTTVTRIRKSLKHKLVKNYIIEEND